MYRTQADTHTGYDEQNRVTVFILIFCHIRCVVDDSRKTGRTAQFNIFDGFLVVIQQFVYRIAKRIGRVIVQWKTMAYLEIGRY